MNTYGFIERDVDKYFPHFDRFAIMLKWPKRMWTLLLQCVLVGKAKEVYSALTLEQSADYDEVKAYQLVPEVYRQKLRRYREMDRQTYVDFGREKVDLFDRWCQSQNVNEP